MTSTILINLALFAVAFGLGRFARRWTDRRRRDVTVEAFSDPGISVEVDCRACGQFNRVRAHRLRDRPKCGRCKVLLMPGKRVVLCRVSTMDRTLARELDAVWRDDDRLWQALADHVAIESKARAEARGEQPRVVN